VTVQHPTNDPVAVFDRAAASWPERPALDIDGNAYSYRKLSGLADAVARECDAELPPGARVAVVAHRAPATYAAVLGILRSGRSYVPLHADHPAARWQQAMERAGVAALVDTRSGAVLQRVHGNDAAQVSGEAYVMFTSGSTGGPKGVPVLRRHVAAYLAHALAHFGITAEDRCTQLFSLAFDLSVHDLFVTWGSGACLCVSSDAPGLRTAAHVHRARITAWFSVPSLIDLMARMRALPPGGLPGIRTSFFCGEALRWDQVQRWSVAAPNSAITNLYGPTEATIAMLEHAVQPPFPATGIVPIGRPFPGGAAMVRDHTLEGELLLGGPQVTEGYLDAGGAHPAFLRAADGTVAWYATGDRVRCDADGVHRFLGRIDDQVKVQGHRVEPAEVDGMLHPLLQGCTSVTVAAERDSSVRLVTFIDGPADAVALLHTLRERLPSYMVPEAILVLEAFPLNPNGKVDRRALKELASHG
jgi:amino acid adenylation domain-containing protein